MGIVLDVAVLYACIKYLLSFEAPAKTAFLYAILSLVALYIQGLFFVGTTLSLLFILSLFIYDLITGYILFYMLNRYIERLFMFYLIIVLAIVYSFTFRYYNVYSIFPH